MFWKSLVCLGLVCALAAPALAVGPTASAKVLGLDVNGNWVWSVGVTPDAGLYVNNGDQGVGGSVAVEIGAVASNRNLVSAGANTTNFEYNNTGNSPFAAPINGVQIGVVTNANDVFAALGSTYFTTGGEKEACWSRRITVRVILRYKPKSKEIEAQSFVFLRWRNLPCL